MSNKQAHYLEQIGRFLFHRIRIQLFLLILIAPPLLAAFYITQQKSSLQGTRSRFCMAMKKGKMALERKARKERFLERHADPNPYFLDTEIEALTFLGNEKRQLQNWLAHPAIPKKESLQERLQFIESDDNRLSFIEEGIDQSELCKETVEKQKHPVEMDTSDLKKLLTLVEDIPLTESLSGPQRPQLLITNFSLRKTTSPLDTELFEVNMDLLKREFR